MVSKSANELSDDPILISALEHYAYCPRQFALIHIEQEFADNVHTMRGNAVHGQVDEPGYEVMAGVRVERALPLYSERLRLTGKADVVEFHPDGRIYPVEFKHGRKRQKNHDDLQLAAQAMCLEEMAGKPVSYGAVYHASSRRRREVEITPALHQQVEAAVEAIRNLMQSGQLPPPVNDKRCRECSLKDICQPEALAATAVHSRLRAHLFRPEE
jgi:CRISPR-associated exonuclease Cas4